VHELSITRSVVAIVAERAAGRRVTRVRLEIGSLSAVVPDAIRFCFDICAADTPLAGAKLEIDEIPGLGCCNDCATGNLRLIAGQELNVKEMETEACA
jgi:hydrogenase nickel incorporation protein HypA/HybF